MKKSTKIWLAITGILLIALGVICIIRPADTLFATAWLIGLLTLFAGISKLMFTFRTQAFLPNSGTRALSAILEIIVGIIFLANSLFLAVSLPAIFAMWIPSYPTADISSGIRSPASVIAFTPPM